MSYLWKTHLSAPHGNFIPEYHQKPRDEILPFISWTPKNILDIGCGGGSTGKLIKDNFTGCHVYGVELDPHAAACASKIYDHVIVGNVESDDWLTSNIPIQKIDTVLLLDVLEHLYNPWQFLVELKKHLPYGCHLVASIPNSFNIQLLDELASGHWRYGPWGLLDITHVRFFTESEMKKLFQETGFTITSIGDIPHPDSMLPQITQRTDGQVATANVTINNLNNKTSNDLFVIQKVFIVSNQASQQDKSTSITHTNTLHTVVAAPHIQAKAMTALRETYLDMMRKCILGLIYEDPTLIPNKGVGVFSAESRENGRDWPAVSHSMIGNKRMRNVQRMAEYVLQQNIPGDFIETGVWRGGACIMMRAVLKAYENSDRKVWVADSFEGLPRPNPENYPADIGDIHFTYDQLAISLTKVQENFAKYGLLDNQVRFLKGWFCDTLQEAPIQQLALMRLDGDMYESTMDALVNLFPKLSRGGIVIIDDYGYIASCKQAVDDYRSKHGIADAIHAIDGFGVYWQNLLPNRISTPQMHVDTFAMLPQQDQISLTIETPLNLCTNPSGVYSVCSKFDDETWQKIMLTSVDNSIVEGIQLPTFADADLQRNTVGSSGKQALYEGYLFYSTIKNYINKYSTPLNKNSKILDFGCGWGRYIRYFLKDSLANNLYGIDVDPVMINACKQSFPYGNFLTVQAFPPTDFPDGHFNVIFAYSVFSHLSSEAADAWIVEFSRILAPGGMLVLTTQGRDFITYCGQIRSSIKLTGKVEHPWHDNLARAFIDSAASFDAYDRGEHLFAATGGGDARPSSFYGEALVSPGYAKQVWGKHLSLLDFIDDRRVLPQALIVMQKIDVTLSCQLLSEGLEYLASGNLIEANDVLLKAHSANPSDPKVIYTLGLVGITAGLNEDASALIRHAIMMSDDIRIDCLDMAEKLRIKGRESDADTLIKIAENHIQQ